MYIGSLWYSQTTTKDSPIILVMPLWNRSTSRSPIGSISPKTFTFPSDSQIPQRIKFLAIYYNKAFPIVHLFSCGNFCIAIPNLINHAYISGLCWLNHKQVFYNILDTNVV